MMRVIQLAVACLVVIALEGQVQAGVITFDEIPATNSFSVSSTIGDFTIVGGLAGIFNLASVGPAHSGTNYVINFNSRVGRIQSTSPFDFVGAFMKNDRRVTSPTTVDFTGRDASNAILFTATRTLGVTYGFETFNWSGITAFEWDPTSSTSTNVNIDDFTFNTVTTTPVPEPSTFALLGIGAVCLIGCGWRRKRKVE